MKRKRLVSPGAGRPRSAEAHTAILDAAIALTREVGFDAVAMDAIASRAGVGKATIYRRWKTKDALIAEALDRLVRAIPVPNIGTVEGDLLAVMRSTMRMYRDPATSALLVGLIAAMARSAPIRDAVRSGFVGARRDVIRQVLQRGVTRGEITERMDIELALDMLSGPLLFRELITGGSIDEGLVAGVVGIVLRGLAS